MIDIAEIELGQGAAWGGYEFYSTDILMPHDLEQEIIETGVYLTMINSDKKWAKFPEHQVNEIFQRGGLRHSKIINKTKLIGHNKLVNIFFNDLFDIYSGVAVANTLEMLYMAIGTNAGTPVADNQTALVNELFRFTPTNKTSDNRRKYYFSKYLTSLEGNPGISTTVAAGSWTPSSFDVVSATNINVGDQVEIYTAADGIYRETAIVSKTGNTLGVDPAKVPTNPTLGDTVIVIHGEIAIFAYPATSDPDSGKMIDRATISQKKTSAAGKYYNCVFNHLAV